MTLTAVNCREISFASDAREMLKPTLEFHDCYMLFVSSTRQKRFVITKESFNQALHGVHTPT